MARHCKGLKTWWIGSLRYIRVAIDWAHHKAAAMRQRLCWSAIRPADSAASISRATFGTTDQWVHVTTGVLRKTRLFCQMNEAENLPFLLIVSLGCMEACTKNIWQVYKQSSAAQADYRTKLLRFDLINKQSFNST